MSIISVIHCLKKGFGLTHPMSEEKVVLYNYFGTQDISYNFVHRINNISTALYHNPEHSNDSIKLNAWYCSGNINSEVNSGANRNQNSGKSCFIFPHDNFFISENYQFFLLGP